MSGELIAAVITGILGCGGAAWMVSSSINKNTLAIMAKMDKLDTKLCGKIDEVDKRLTGKIDALRIDVQKIDKRLHGVEVLYLNKVFPKLDENEDNHTELEEG